MGRMRCLFCAVVLAILVSASALPRSVAGAQRPAGIIEGRVLAQPDGSPLQGAEVWATTGRGSTSGSAATDSKGNFRITGLPTGSYTVHAMKVGYATLAFGQQEVTDQRAVVELGNAPVSQVNVYLPRAAALTVVVRDALGEPLPGVVVGALLARFADGERRLVAATTAYSPFPRTTDDRGEVRLFALAPGEYFVGARLTRMGMAGDSTSNPETFYPGTVQAEMAQSVVLEAGADLFIDLPLSSTARGTLTASVVSSTGSRLAAPRTQVMVVLAGGTATVAVDQSTPDGFVAKDLPPGDYLVQVSGQNSLGGEEFYSRIHRFDGEDAPVAIQTNPFGTIQGRLVFQDEDLKGVRPSIEIGLEILGYGRRPTSVEIRSDWSFEIKGVAGLGMLRPKDTDAKWFMRSVILAGRDISDELLDLQTAFGGDPVEIHLSRKTTQLSGSVNTATGERTDSYTVLAFAVDPALWRPRSRYITAKRVEGGGGFTLTGLPQGSYFLIALDRFEGGREYDKTTLSKLSHSAVRITLAEGESRFEPLRLMSRRELSGRR